MNDPLEDLRRVLTRPTAAERLATAMSELAEVSHEFYEREDAPAYIVVAAVPEDDEDRYQDVIDALVSAGFSYDDDRKAFVLAKRGLLA